jgi:DNA-binding SARP family transcriptional activator
LASLQLYFFGPLEMRCDDQPAPRPPTLKSLSLLAYMVFHRDQPQPRERLASLYFGERAEQKALRSLSTALWHIHRCLPEASILLSDARSVQINPQIPIWLDVEEFEILAARADSASLQKAIALYRGDFLEGFYDDWAISERYRLESLYLDALARLVSVLESAGDPQASLAAAYRLLSRDTLREDAYQAAMRSLCRLGQRKAALEQYERCRETIQNELGTQPAVETTELYQAILNGSFVADSLPDLSPMVARPLENPGHSPFDVTATAPLAGRDQEIIFLEDCWRAAQAGRGSLALVSGEAGVGKTRLVKEFTDRLRWQGVPAAWGNCYEFESYLPYQPIAGALRNLLLMLSNADLAEIPDWAFHEVARLVPELLERQPRKEPHQENLRKARGERPSISAPVPGLNSTQELLFEGVARVLQEVASRRTLLFVLEDLHWASESTLQLLHHLAHSFSALPVLVVGTYRTDMVDARHPIRGLLRQLAGKGLAHQIELSRLSPEVVEAIIGKMSGVGEAAVPLAKRLYQETEGNPFFLMEIIKTLFETGQIQLIEGIWQGNFTRISEENFPLSSNMSEAVQARVLHLHETIQEGLHLAAVLGREFNYELLLAAWGKGEEATLELLDELLRHRLVEEKAGAEESDFAFTHHKIQEIIYQELPRHRCFRLHAQVGLAMESIYQAEIESRAGELAHHFEQACRLDKSLCGRAIQYLLKAGQQSERQLAYQEAVRYYQRGLAIPHILPETEIDLQLALVVPVMMMKGYTSPEVNRIYGRVRDLCMNLDQTPALFTALSGLSRYYGLTGNPEKHKQLAEQLLNIARKSGETILLIQAYRDMANCLFEAGQLGEAREVLEKGFALYDPSLHMTLASRFGHDPALTFLAYLSMVLWLSGYPKQAQEKTCQLKSLLSSFSNTPSRAISHIQLAIQASLQTNPRETLEQSEESIRLSLSHGMSNWVAFATALQGWALFKQGNLEAIDMLSEGIKAWLPYGFTHLTPYVLSLQADCLCQLKRTTEGLYAIQAALDLSQRGVDKYWLAELYRLQGLLRLEGGADCKIVEASFHEAIETARQQGARMLELRATMNLAQLWCNQGKTRVAYQVLAEIYHRFTEGFDLPDLQAASRLLQELSCYSPSATAYPKGVY